MQVFFILFSVHFAVYQYINSKCLYRTHVKIDGVAISAHGEYARSDSALLTDGYLGKECE